MRRSSLRYLVGGLALLLAGCGGSGGEPATTAASPPSPSSALRALASAAHVGNVAGVRALLTPSTPRATAAELVEGLGSFPPRTRIVLAERIDETWAVAALAGPRRAEGMKEYGTFAVPLKLVDGRWKAHLDAGTIEIRPLGPRQGSVQARTPSQVAAEFSALVAIDDAGLWLDGAAIAAKSVGSPVRYTAYGPTPPLRRGYHTVVGFAETGGTASAVAWWFRVR